MSHHEPEISVVLPVHGSRAALAELWQRVHHTLERLSSSWEVIFVEDACPEGSVESLEALAETDSRVVILALARNVGQHEAVRIGLLEARGSSVFVMDADLQDPPEAIEPMLAQLRAGAPAVFAGRLGAYESRFRLTTAAIFKALVTWVARVPHDTGMYVGMSRRTVEKVLRLERRGFYLVAAIGICGVRATSVPVQRALDPTARSGYSGLRRLTLGARLLAWTCACRLGLGLRSEPDPPAAPFRRIQGQAPEGDRRFPMPAAT
jgi:glycosyltransferase involved in cell wall biosynthesis